jgi:hypothetical protein
MKFEIDVSGSDIFEENYVICIASNEIIKGFKFSKELVTQILERWKGNNYRYEYNKFETKRSFLKVRIYCIIIYYLFKSISEKPERISITICKDFYGHRGTINSNLKFLLEDKLGIKIGNPLHQRLQPFSLAHRYAKMMYGAEKNLLPTYVSISLEDLEKFLKKRLH